MRSIAIASLVFVLALSFSASATSPSPVANATTQLEGQAMDCGNTRRISTTAVLAI